MLKKYFSTKRSEMSRFGEKCEKNFLRVFGPSESVRETDRLMVTQKDSLKLIVTHGVP